MLIALTGKMTSGKTALAQELCRTLGFKKFAFGDQVKIHCIKAGLLTQEESDQKTPYARFIWQHIATNLIRDQVDQNYWIKKLDIDIRAYKREKDIIIDDLRFFNEADYVRSKGGYIIRITRPDIIATEKELAHRSEAEQDNIQANYIIENEARLQDLFTVGRWLIEDVIRKIKPSSEKRK